MLLFAPVALLGHSQPTCTQLPDWLFPTSAPANSRENIYVIPFLQKGPPGEDGAQGPAGEPGTPGTTDHGALSGLSDDDHPQYLMTGETDTITTEMIVDANVTNAKIADVAPAKISPQGASSGLDADTVDGIESTRLGVLTGEVRMWAGPIAAVPSGWLPCDGSAISRTTYANLFAVIGDIYGPGDGSTTFNLPDLRDRSPIGASQDSSGVPMTNVTGSLTQTGGAATHTLTESEMPSHIHDMTHTHNINVGSGLGISVRISNGLLGAPSTIATTTPNVTDTAPAGGDQPHPILDPYIAIHFIICTGN